MRVKTGQYQKLEDKDRICLLCDSELEIHFLTDCFYFSDEMRLVFNFVQKNYSKVSAL